MVGRAWCIALSCLLCSGSFLTSPLIGTLSLALVAPLSITYDIVFEHVRNTRKYTMILHVCVPLNSLFQLTVDCTVQLVA